MGAKGTKPPSDSQIAKLAERQHGVVARRQLEDVGLGRRSIAQRLRAGRLHPVHRGVYAVGHPLLESHGRYLAAVLACGEGAVLSHRSAAAVWGIGPHGTGWVDVRVPSSGGRKRDGILVHRATLTAAEVTERHRIPVTTPGRTLVDLADVLSRRALERAIDQAEYRRLDCAGLRPLPGRVGAGRLGAVLAEHRAGTTLTRSDLEEMFLAFYRHHRLPRPEVNFHVEAYEADFVWRSRLVIVEMDGYAGHRTRRAFERDRVRDAEHVLAGYRVLRITHRRLVREPGTVAAQLRRLLGTN